MKFTHSWLLDFINTKLSAESVADQLTAVGHEVTSLKKEGDDWVYELEITSNRPDLLSVLGIARELSAITGNKLKTSVPSGFKSSAKKKKASPLKIKIDNTKDCPFYTGKIIRGVKVAPSPKWLQKRLELVGLRPVNNIVDITNYVLLSLGQPLHAFDLDKLNDQTIIVRRAKANEKIVAIDGQELALDKQILVIADSKVPVAVAGVMGGKDTEVSEDAQNILLESAKFDPLIVRHSRQKLALASESSYRFERNIDIHGVEPASSLAVKMIKDIAGGFLSIAKSAGSAPKRAKKLSLKLPEMDKLLGISTPSSAIKKILNGLGFKVKQSSSKSFNVDIPTFRQDINQQVDLIEEVARVWGYDKIPQTLPNIKPSVQEGQNTKDLIAQIRQLLFGQGMNEAVTYSLIGKDMLKRFDLKTDQSVDVLNPLSLQQEVLRPMLSPGLLAIVGNNVNKQNAVAFFEIAHIFQPGGAKFHLALALCGQRQFYTSAEDVIVTTKDQMSLLHLKGVIELVLQRLGISGYEWVIEEQNFCNASQAVSLKVNSQNLGFLGQIKEKISEDFEVKNKPVFMAELCLDSLLTQVNLKKKFKALPLYPSVSRDISLLIKDDIATLDLLNAIRKDAPSLLQEVAVVDYYKGKQIPKGFKGLTLSCDYMSPERTLTDDQVSASHREITSLLEQKFQAQLR